MVKKLRLKFMAVTMALMLIVFSAFMEISYVNDNYWNITDTSNTLEWIAESGVFTNAQIVHDDVDVTEEIEDEDSLIVGIITDKNGNILSQQKIRKGQAQSVNQELVDKILSQKEDKLNYKSYVYTVKDLSDGNKLIVLQDTSNKSNAAARAFGTALIILGVGALALLTFFLSKFITEPARKALEREKQFVSDASHELKTPISAIRINAQALEMESDNINVKNILSETKRMNSLIEKLLTLSKYEKTPIKDKEICSMSDILNEISLTYESIAFEKEIGYQYACSDYWEKTHDYSDANCRMTAMLLMGDLIKVDNPKKDYDGTYLMMDIDAIENTDRYKILKDREADFTTLFGEMKIPESGISDALPQNWKEHGIHFDTDKISLISVVIEDTMSPVAFVGHTGLLIDEGDYLLFVEKIAFEQPYQVTKFNNTDELVAMLSARPEYTAEEGKEPSVICQNDKVIGKIEANNTAA